MIPGMARTSLPVELSASDQAQLQQWASAHGTPQQVALRCRLVLAAAAGQSDLAILLQPGASTAIAPRFGGGGCERRGSKRFGRFKPGGAANRSMTRPVGMR